MRFELYGHFSYQRLVRFVISPVLMMICTSVYSVIDGFFVSNYVGKIPFAAVNLVMPVDLVAVAIGFMIGEGGNAIISKTMGEGRKKRANQYFSLLVYTTAVIGICLSLIGFNFMPQIADALGASPEMREHCIIYGKILFSAQLFYVLQNIFQSFFIAAGKPDLSFKVALLAGVTNALLDFLFIVVFDWGLAGAAWATAAGQMVAGIVPLIYFARPNSSLLRLGKTVFYPKIILHTFTNGSSEMVSILATSIVTIAYNYQLMSLIGDNGVAAYGAVMYVNFIFMAIFLGYASGVSPLISYQYGAKNVSELQNLFLKSLMLVGGTGVFALVLSEALAAPLIQIFVGYDQELCAMTIHGFKIYVISFLFMGLNIFASALFTALGNGLVSSTISMLRALVFELGAVFLLPMYLGVDGIWGAIVLAELCTLAISTFFIINKKSRYGYYT